jgi:hypothetical protein
MSFAEDGYAVVPLFSRGEVARLQEAVAAHMARTASALLKPREETAPDAPFDQRLEQIAATDPSFAQLLCTAVATDAQRDPAVVALANDRRLTDAAEAATGRTIDDRLFRFRANSSALSGQRPGWHSDVARMSGACSKVLVAGWIPLTGVSVTSGGLELVRGRRAEPVDHHESHGHLAIDEADLRDADIVAPEIRAGHCLLIDRFTPHRASENTTGLTQWSLVVWMKV